MNTDDSVEVEGDWLRVLGRNSDIINVGGQKVFPAEVENILMEAANVEDASVHGEAHPLMGQVIVARVHLAAPEEPGALRTRLRRHCLGRLAPFKVPVRFLVGSGIAHTERFKKVR